jgi:hypothetical protein
LAGLPVGLPTNTEFKTFLLKAFTLGSSYGSSRNANIKLTAYENSEHFLAKFIKAGSRSNSIIWNVGGKIVIASLNSQTDCFFIFEHTYRN